MGVRTRSLISALSALLHFEKCTRRNQHTTRQWHRRNSKFGIARRDETDVRWRRSLREAHFGFQPLSGPTRRVIALLRRRYSFPYTAMGSETATSHLALEERRSSQRTRFPGGLDTSCPGSRLIEAKHSLGRRAQRGEMPPCRPPSRKREPVDRVGSLKTIEVLLDYAILESAQLELPFVVCLLRMARLELDRTLTPEKNAPHADGIH